MQLRRSLWFRAVAEAALHEAVDISACSRRLDHLFYVQTLKNEKARKRGLSSCETLHF